MKFFQKWSGTYIKDKKENEFFPCKVPGNIQLDYADAHGTGNVNYSDNCTKFKELEDYFWKYRCEPEFECKNGERIFFVAHGIEYEYDIILNGGIILHHTGMFSKAEADITDRLKDKNLLEILIYPHPKRDGVPECRAQADQSVKPAVEYGWDWHPRLLVSGLWDECYLETRNEFSITSVKSSYVINDTLTEAELTFDIDCNAYTEIEITDPRGKCVYKGNDKKINLENIMLWWCNGQGEQNLYTWKVTSLCDTKTGRIGFKKIRLVMNEGAWDEPSEFPKTRSFPPMTFELNNRRIFAKGSNWVNPEIFNGIIDENRYRELLVLAKEANMNLLRCWGGAIVNKEAFFDICDELGIMVWQEFPLACNNYIGTDEYLSVLEAEAKAIIERIKQHVCLVLWCGGNELFNSWSRMTDQSYALRLLNKLCYEYDRGTPFIPTSPIMGMGHGHYTFYDVFTKQTVHEIFRKFSYTAYSEFGIPSITDMEYLREIFPPEILAKPEPGTPWELHHGYNAWGGAGDDAWLCFGTIDEVFGKQDALEDYIACSNTLQCEGLKYIFEEARRQKPSCSVALSWCFNEPWITAAGLSLTTYPARPKKAYYAVKNSLSPVVPSARTERFFYRGGDLFRAELFLLNDSQEPARDTVEVYIKIDDNTELITVWNSGLTPANTNKRGIIVQHTMPTIDKTQLASLILKGKTGTNEYKFLLRGKTKQPAKKHLNM